MSPGDRIAAATDALKKAVSLNPTNPAAWVGLVRLSLAIGRRGQNVRLASQLTGMDIDILTEEEESKRRQAEFNTRTQLFMDTLDLDEFFAQLLVAEGFTNLEEVAYVDLDELLTIDGVDEGTAQELQARARDHLEAAAKAALDNARALGAEDSLIEFEGLTAQMVEALAKVEAWAQADPAGVVQVLAPQIKVRIDYAAAAQYGLTAADVSEALATGIGDLAGVDDVWALSVDTQSSPRLLIENAWSPAVVR